MARACVLLADGFEEIEAVTVIDVLRRAGVEVMVLGVAGMSLKGSHDIRVEADGLLSDHVDDEFDAVILPGGMPGAATLRDDALVDKMLRRQHERGGTLAAICAAPIALGKRGLLEGKKATCYPGFEGELVGAEHSEARVVVDGHTITSRGPGTALEFALALVEHLKDRENAEYLRKRMLV